MKIMVLTRASDSSWHLALGADSAVLRHGEPVFLPESGLTASMAVVPALRIGRLGFCIRSNFASYIDAATLFLYVRPHHEDTPGWLPPYTADRSFSPGEWMALPADGLMHGNVHTGPLPGRAGTQAEFSFTASLRDLEPERQIKEISKYCTVKTGDILLFPEHGTPMIPALMDTVLTAKLNGSPVIDIRLK